MEQSLFVAITGTKHYYGSEFLKIGQVVHLTKEPHNEYDHEAIRIDMIPLGKIGYVANSVYSVPKGCRSAGRVYDSFDQQICGIVRFIVKEIAIVELMPDIEEVYIVQKKKENGSYSSSI